MKLQGKKLLVVDDSKAIHAFVRDALKEKGVQISSVYDGKQAVELISQGLDQFDVICLDWEMPIMTGPETFQQFKLLKLTTPVVMMTSKSKIEDLTQMLEAGVSEYVMKPVTPDILIEKLESVLKG